jgi:nucleoside-diphosphate-sugar epimerase
MKVLATGATGKYAHHVVAALTAQGVQIRGAVTFADYDRVGFDGGNPLVLQAILQRPPRSVADFIAELGQARD